MVRRPVGADEAAAALLRTAFSTIVRESNDFACVLMDRNGDSISENTGGIETRLRRATETSSPRAWLMVTSPTERPEYLCKNSRISCNSAGRTCGGRSASVAS